MVGAFRRLMRQQGENDRFHWIPWGFLTDRIPGVNLYYKESREMGVFQIRRMSVQIVWFGLNGIWPSTKYDSSCNSCDLNLSGFWGFHASSGRYE